MLTFSDNDVTVPAHHNRKSIQNSSQNPACSVVVASDDKPVTVYVPRNCVVEAGHEIAVRVFSKTAPRESTPAVIEPRIATTKTIEAQGQHNVWDTVIVARTVTNWSAIDKSAIVQIANPSNRTVTIRAKTVVGKNTSGNCRSSEKS